MRVTSIHVSRETRKLLESLKTKGETYDEVIRALVVSHPSRLSAAEIARRIRDDEAQGPIEELVAKSRTQKY